MFIGQKVNDDGNHPFRLPRRAAWRQAGAGRRRFPQRRAPLRPDERSDVVRAASGLEGCAGHGARSAEKPAVRAARYRRRHRRRGVPRHCGRRRANTRDSCRHQCRHARCRPRARRRARLGRRGRLHRGQCRGVAVRRPQLRCRDHRLRHPQRGAHRDARSPRRFACSRSAANFSVWNSPPWTCPASTGSTSSTRSTSSPRSAAWSPATRNRIAIWWNRSAASRARKLSPRCCKRRALRRVTHTLMTGGIVALHRGWRL